MCRLLTCHEEMLVRAGIRAILAVEPGIHIVAEADSAQQALELTIQSQPDIVLTGTLAAAIHIASAASGWAAISPRPSLRGVLALITPEEERDDSRLLEAIRAGVRGLVSKDASAPEFSHAIKVTCAGRSWLTPQVTRRMLDWIAHAAPAVTERFVPGETLTTAELKVLTFLARGMLSEEIARTLSISEATVRSHVHHVLTKLGLRNRAQAVAFAYQHGLVPMSGVPPQ